MKAKSSRANSVRPEAEEIEPTTSRCCNVADLSWFDDLAAGSGDGVNLGEALWERKHLRAFLPWGKTALSAVLASPSFPQPYVLPTGRGSRAVWLRRDVLLWVVSHKRVEPARCDAACACAAAALGIAQATASDEELAEARRRVPDGWTVERKGGA